MKKVKFTSNFFKKYPNFPKTFFHYYVCEKDGAQYVFFCNFHQQSQTILKIKQQIQSYLKGGKTFEELSKCYVDNPSVLNFLTKFYLSKNFPNKTKENFLSFLQDQTKTNDKYSLKKENVVVGYKINQNGKIQKPAVFKMNFKIQNIKKNKQKVKRIFIESAESFERGKGLYSQVLNYMIEKICRKANIRHVVLNASSYDSDKTGKGTQQKLESFYKRMGFYKLEEDEEGFASYAIKNDFEKGMPVYCKEIDFEKCYYEPI